MNERFRWEKALRESDLHPTTRYVLLMLGTYMDQHGTAWPSQMTLAESCGLSDRAVRKHLEIAIREGWLYKARQGRHVGRGRSYSSIYEAEVPVDNPAAGGTTVPVEGFAGGTTVPVEDSQPEPGRPQPEREGTPTGTTVPPISSRKNSSDKSARAPSDLAFARQKALKLGRNLAREIEDEWALADAFDSDPVLKWHPDLLPECARAWSEHRARLAEFGQGNVG